MNLFENIFDKFTKQAQPQVPTSVPQAPRTASYVAPNIPTTTTPKIAQGVRNSGFAPGYEGTVDTSQNFLNRILTPVEKAGTSLFQNQVQGGKQLSDIAMKHSESAIDRGYNQGYINLGRKIKEKHPQYSDISDEELGRKIVAKYPQYQDIVDAGSGIMSNPISGSLASIESGLSKGLGTMFQGISNLGSAPLQETGTAGVTRFTKGALETGLGSAQLATSIMPTTLGAKALVAPTVNTLFSTDTAGKVLQPISQGIETGIGMGQEALGYNPESIVSKDIQNIGSTVGNLALFAGAQKGGAKGYDLAKPFVNKAVQKVSNIPNPITGAKNVITREIPVGIMERDLSLTPTERASIETINGKPAGAVALEYNLPKDKQAMADTLSVKADEAYNGITNDLKNIHTRTESVPAKEMLGIMLDEMGSSPILVRTMKPYMEKLQSMMEQPDYSLAEKNAIRRDFDRIVANKIFDSKGRVSGIEDKAIANIRERLSTELQNEAMQYGIDIKGKNDILRTSIALRDGVLRRLSQENKNNKIGLQDIGVGAILGAGDPLTTASVIFGKKVLEKSSPGIAQKLYNSNKTPYATSNLKRGVTISPRDTTNGLSITPDNVSTVRIPVKKPIVKPVTPKKPVKPERDLLQEKYDAEQKNAKPIIIKKQIVKPNSTTNAKQPRNIVEPSTKSDSDIPEGYFKNAFGEIVKNPSNKNGGFIRNPFAKPEPKRLFAGENSAQPPKGKTGWFKGADGKMRFEIDDSGAKFYDNAKVNKSGKALLGDIFRHDDLFNQYPETKSIIVKFNDTVEKGGGSYNPSTRTLTINGLELDPRTGEFLGGTKEAKSTLLHEIQHAIQEKEGFARGGSIEGKLFGQEAVKEINRKIESAKENIAFYDKIGNSFEKNTSENKLSKLYKMKEELISNPDSGLSFKGQQTYERIAGEVEARNVQSRMNLTAKERTIKSPESTEDVPRAKQIIRMDSKGPSMSIKVPEKKIVKPVEKTVKAIDKNAVKDAVGNWKPVNGKYAVSNIDISKTNAFPREKYHREDYVNTPSYKYWLEQAKKGDNIPPVVVEKTPTGYNVVDGYHRLAAVEDAGIKDIKAIVLDTPILKGEKAKGVKQFTSFSDSEIEKILNTKPLSTQKTVKPLTEGKQSATMGDMETKKLIEEAKSLGKYDGSYDVTKGKKLYRGGSEDGVFWTDDIDIAKSFGDEGVAEKIITMKKPLDVRSKDIREYIKKNTDINIDDATSAYSRSLPEFKKLMKWAKENGYDGIIGKTSDNGLNFTGNEFVTLSPPKPLSPQKTVKQIIRMDSKGPSMLIKKPKQSDTMGDMETKKLATPEELLSQFTGRDKLEVNLSNLKKTSPDGFSLEKVSIDKLKHNIRIDDFENPTESIGKIKGIIEQYKKDGKLKPIILDKNGNVLDGNHRVNAYKMLGIKEIPVYFPVLSDIKKIDNLATRLLKQNQSLDSYFSDSSIQNSIK